MCARVAFLILTIACLPSAPAAGAVAETPADKSRRLTAVLESGASFYDKARACQQLGEVGDRQAVPALAALLGDDHLSAYARSGLENIPDPSAAEALRRAARTLHGRLLAGVVNSLGVLRDAQAAGLMKTLADDAASGVAKEALLALGRIATDEALASARNALASHAEKRRADAAAACLLAAETRLADGDAATAVALYDDVRRAHVPPPCRAAATRGAIVARNADGLPLLAGLLRSEDRVVRHAALFAIREMPCCEALADALNAALGQAPVEMQLQLLTALADCHNAQSLAALEGKAASEHAEVRQTALAVLGRIGSATQAKVLLDAVAANRSPVESTVALNSLRRLQGTAVDAQILHALARAPAAATRAHLIRLLEQRAARGAIPVLLEQAADADVQVSVAAFRALKSLADFTDLPALIALTTSRQNDAAREAAENAVAGVCTRTGNTGPGSEAVLTEFKRAADPAAKNSWIRVLVSLGSAPALPTLLATMNDSRDPVALQTLDQLARWPDPAPVEHLLAVAETGANAARRNRALASAIRLATTAADERQRPEDTLVRWLERASRAAQTTGERRLVISGLGRLKRVESLRVLAAYLNDPGVRNEAAGAVLQIAPALCQANPPLLRQTLENIAATAPNPDFRRQAAKLAGTLPAQHAPRPLFDGRSLAGWEGNTNVWRVRDGAIVGGSLEGNPRNEFLATLRSYTNFVLRLEYKLVGTGGFVNGGVQFHSVRVQQPPNEMRGYQADIGAGYSGSLYDESRRNKVLMQAAKDQAQRLEKPGDWNRYEVHCHGPRIRIALNGETTVDYTEPDAAIPAFGLIALQIHGNGKSEIAFRNLTVEEGIQP